MTAMSSAWLAQIISAFVNTFLLLLGSFLIFFQEEKKNHSMCMLRKAEGKEIEREKKIFLPYKQPRKIRNTRMKRKKIINPRKEFFEVF